MINKIFILKGLKTFLMLSLLAALVSCATAYDKRGVYHRVRRGESISKIAKYYHVSVQELAEWNNIQSPEEVTEGLKLYIPKSIAKKAEDEKKKGKKGDKDSETITFERSKFIWPVEGIVFSNYGIRKGRRHDGVDISADPGTPIHAAANGKVVFDGKMRGYGNMIIIKHKDRFFTVYAHNSQNAITKGQKVAKGDLIGYVGATGRASGPHLHFEVRQGQESRNPLFFLPAEGVKKIQYASRKNYSTKSSKGKKAVKSSKTSKSASKTKKESTKTVKKDDRRKVMMENLKAKKSR